MSMTMSKIKIYSCINIIIKIYSCMFLHTQLLDTYLHSDYRLAFSTRIIKKYLLVYEVCVWFYLPLASTFLAKHIYMFDDKRGGQKPRNVGVSLCE